MKVFGPLHEKPKPISGSLYDPGFVETPVGEMCLACEMPVGETDSGFILPFYFVEDDLNKTKEVAYHRRCLLKSMGIQE